MKTQDALSPKRVLITGASGQVGSEFKLLWQDDANFEIIFADRTAIPLDKPELVYQQVLHLQPDYIIHAAAYTMVDKAEEETELVDRINHRASLEFAKAARELHAKMIFISTDYVFPGDINEPLKEDQPTDPINAYGRSKQQAEIAILKTLAESIIIRTSWVYSRFGKNFVKTMLQLMENRDEIQVVNDQFGSPTYAKDLAEAIQQIVKSGNWTPGIYHYSNEGKTTWCGFAEKIKEFAGLSCRINPVDSNAFPTLAKRPSYSLLSKEKIKETFGIQIPKWEDSLRNMLQEMQETHNN